MNVSDIDSPIVYVIAGPNGAGKTTFATEFLPNFVNCREFLNADMIASGLSPFAPEKQNILAGRLLLQRLRELADARDTFALETTLAGRSYLRLFSGLKAKGFRLELFFLWLPSADVALKRVAARVRQGGHDIPEVDVRRRFESGLRNFFGLYGPLADVWWLYDMSGDTPALIATQEGPILNVVNPSQYLQIRTVGDRR
ncbi:MAG TPA: AAA family ATPase [Pirellulales bacterium]|jgi:predicted ABC-type ATPase|nr:AAA family ATPase [Pirellulales bacterium]